MSLASQLAALNLITPLQQQLLEMGFAELTPVQQQAIPEILKHRDVMAKAATGSGKTLAFAIGILQRLDVEVPFPQALVLCPTRELAEQVANSIRQLARKLSNTKVQVICGGTPIGPQIQSLKHGSHIIVATPGRLLAHLRKRRINLNALQQVVLDEADRMLDLGFEQDLIDIMGMLPVRRQTLLFSATFPSAIEPACQQWLQEPISIDVTDTQSAPDIEFLSFHNQQSRKANAVAAILSEFQPSSAILFCPTKQMARDLAADLQEMHIACMALHGDMQQAARSDVLACFANGSCNLLIATDVAARGLDIEHVDMVLNVTVPDNQETLVHRAGRTARAGASGRCVTLVEDHEQPTWRRCCEELAIDAKPKGIASLRFHLNRIVTPDLVTLYLDAGKKAKLRPTDILGALSKEAEVPAEDIGKIQIAANHSYVAIKLRSVKRSMKFLRENRLKGKKVRARKLR
ncbi:ATP-dependent RNA helicase DbpA [Aestuariibacter salexigens]|uniref:ATP-dependent RNA helicase DbpA n=1 Tax=Aestuariibacter salexigens TaxID=226010 RepID=UPI0004046ACD|nr:ATP-dependent RNA helicase DbpA [Aestuariibacter salexigens]